MHARKDDLRKEHVKNNAAKRWVDNNSLLRFVVYLKVIVDERFMIYLKVIVDERVLSIHDFYPEDMGAQDNEILSCLINIKNSNRDKIDKKKSWENQILLASFLKRNMKK